MKNKEKKQLHSKNIDELHEAIKQAKAALFAMVYEKTQGKLKNTASLSIKRREIAIMATLLKEKEIHENI